MSELLCHHVEKFGDPTPCGIYHPAWSTTGWNGCTCPKCNETRTEESKSALPFRCSECGADRAELDPCQNCDAG